MKTNQRILAIASAALLLGVAFAPAHAIDLNIGGIGVSANLGGGSVASAGVSSEPTGGQVVNLAINDTSGDLVELNQNEDQIDGAVNLGLDGLGLGDLGLDGLGLDDILGGGLDGILPGDDDTGGGLTPTQLASAFGGLAPADQQLLRNRCRSVLGNPVAFEPSLVELCRIIARMQVGLN
jgi:hypothetical protein